MNYKDMTEKEYREYLQEVYQNAITASTIDAWCNKCGEWAGDFEPDASRYDCDVCEEKGCVNSILIMEGMI